MAFAPSSYIPTGAAVDTRARDQLSFPFLARPQAMTVYMRFVEMGSVLVSSVARVFDISNGTAARFLVQSTGSVYALFHITAAGQVTVSLGAGPTYGQLVELRAVLNANGSILLGQSINGAAETVTATSAALTLAQTWSAQNIFFNASSGGTFTGFIALRNVEIKAGVFTMQQMRQIAGTDS